MQRFTREFLPKQSTEWLIAGASLLLLIVVTVFIIYLPSLKSDFVYDARIEMLQEGFITSSSNLFAVLSLKVLSMKLMLGDRPGQLLYLMLIAVVWGKNPIGYHLCSNLLHTVNVSLLFILLYRLIALDARQVTRSGALCGLKTAVAAGVATLLFALHPVAVESVSEVSYSSSLLVALFTLLALLAATYFDPRVSHVSIIAGIMGIFCSLAAVMAKESGVATPLLLIGYWLLFRLKESKGPWLLFCGIATAVNAIFLAARFLLAPANPQHMYYIGGSLSHVFLIQPRIWIFMMSKLIMPEQLSADYTPQNINIISTYPAITILIAVILWQILLAYKSRLGALGVMVYWAGLLTVSNFVPLYRFTADRFYYLPLIGFAMQVLALLLLALRTRWVFYVLLMLCLAAIPPLTSLSVAREAVFANEYSLWTATLKVSPFSSTAHGGYGLVLEKLGKIDAGMVEFQKALQLNPYSCEAHNNLGIVFIQKAQLERAMAEFQETVEINPDFAEAHNNLGIIYFHEGQMDKAIYEYQKALAIRSNYEAARANLAEALLQKGLVNDALAQFQKSLNINPNSSEADKKLGNILSNDGHEALNQLQQSLKINPNNAAVHYHFGLALFREGQVAEAMAQYRKALEINTNNTETGENLDNTLSQKRQSNLNDAGYHYGFGLVLFKNGQVAEALAQYQEAVEIDPQFAPAYNGIGTILSQNRQADDAISEYNKALKIDPDNAEAHYNLGLTLFQERRLVEAIAQYRRALEINPNYIQAYNNLGSALSQEGKVDEAISQYQKALKIDPNYAQAHNGLGSALSQKGKFAEAIIEFHRSLEIRPYYTDAHFNLGVALGKIGQIDAAITQYQMALKENPNFAPAHNNVGAALIQKGQIREAIAHFTDAVRLEPDFKDAQNNLAEANSILRQ